MDKHRTAFNRGGTIKSELDSEEKRAEKIMEMNQRGYIAIRTYELERTYNDWVATGYNAAKFRHKGESSNMRYGVVFRHQSTVEGITN